MEPVMIPSPPYGACWTDGLSHLMRHMLVRAVNHYGTTTGHASTMKALARRGLANVWDHTPDEDRGDWHIYLTAEGEQLAKKLRGQGIEDCSCCRQRAYQP